MAKKQLSLKEILSPLWDILIFKSKTAIETVSAKGIGYLPVALAMIFIFSLFNFLVGFNLTSMLGFIKTIGFSFLQVVMILFFGKLIFNSKTKFWNLFSPFQYINIIILYLIPIILITLFIPFLGDLLIFLWAIYVLILSILVVKIVLKIKPWQGFLLLLISGIIILSLEYAISLLFNVPAVNLVGEAMKITG